MGTLALNIDDTILQKAKQRAQSEGQSLDQIVSKMLYEWTIVWAPPGVPRGAQQYVVKRGDTLAQIALRFYGDAKRYIDIAQANSITNPGMIRVGQVLIIPDLSAHAGAPSTTPQPVTTQPTTPQPVTPQPTTPQPVTPQPTTPQPVTPSITVPGLAIEFIESPHYNRRPAGSKIWCIVIHATANSTLEGVIKWFQNPQSFVSAHYNIGKDGRIVQMVADELRAWHAGKSVWKGIEDVNNFSIGIELVNKNDGQDPYPPAQYQVTVALCKALMQKYGIKAEDIVSHKAISLSGKTDPMGLDMDQLRRDVSS